MITIEKNGKKLIVSKSGFKEYYENQGWKISGKSKDVKKPEPVNTSKPETSEETENESGDESEEDWSEFEDETPEEVEKPLSEMNKSELREKAASLGIDVSGDYTNSQLRDMIKEAL